MTYLIVDTNVLLHYRRLEEIDWLNLSKSKEAIIVLCPVVIRELDQHKISHPQSKIRRRAQEVIVSLHPKLSGEESDVIRNGVRLEFVAEDPSIDFHTHRLRPEIADDWLIAGAIEMQRKNPNDEVKIVSADLALSIKAKAQNIKVLRPLEADKLPDQLDESEKRIRELQKELAEIKNALPEPKLCFWKSEKPNVIQLQLQQPIPFSEDEANAEMNQIRARHPFFTIPPEPKIGGGFSIQNVMRRSVSQSAADGYNADLNSFYQDYEKYLRQKHEFKNEMRRSVTLEIGLENSGTVPADDIDVHLHFPDGFSLFDAEENLPECPKPPEPPEEIGTFRNLSSLTVPSFRNFDYAKVAGPPSNISSPQIERTNSYDVRSQIKKAKHGYILRISKFLVQFDGYESAASFKIDYSISAANLPKAVTGYLSVVIEKPS